MSGNNDEEELAELSEQLLSRNLEEANVSNSEAEGENAQIPIAAAQATRNTKDFAGFAKYELLILWELSFPLFVSFCCRMAMASTDSAFVGHLGTKEHEARDYLAASTLSDMVLGVVMAPPLAFNIVLNALVGQAVGSGNKLMAGVWLQQSIFFLTFGMLICMPSVFYVADLLRLLGFDKEICELAGIYARWNIFWFIPNGWYQCMRFYFQALGIPRPAMYNNILFVFINALLNWIFVFGGPFQYLESFRKWKGFGFIGAAISLSISRCAQPLAYWFYMFKIKHHHEGAWPGLYHDMHTKERLREFMVQAIPRVGTILFRNIIGQSTTILISQLGTDAVAASSASNAVTRIFSGALNATFTAVTAIRVGFHLGNGHMVKARQTAYLVMILVGALTLLPSIFIYAFRETLMDVVTNDPLIEKEGASLMLPLLLGILFGVLVQICTSGIFGGQGRTTLIAILSFAFEMPMSIGGIAIVIYIFGAHLSQVYWWIAFSSLFELIVCLFIVEQSDWKTLSVQAKERNA